MKQATVRLDDRMHTILARLAEQRGVSLNHVIYEALERFISFEEAFERLEDRASRAHSGALQTALSMTAVQQEPPEHLEDHIPPGFDREVLERRIAQETALYRSREQNGTENP